MWLFNRRLDQLTADDIDQVVRNRLCEGISLEFKREMYGGSDAEIREMLRDVSSMANAEGAVLLIGIDEDDQGCARAITAIPDAEAQADRLISSCVANISERIPGLRARVVNVKDSNVVVVQIPRSYRKPHMITFKGATDFWIRHDRQKSRMSIAEIRAAIATTEDLAMKADRFIKQRLERLLGAPDRSQEPTLLVMGTPLLLEEGRIDISDAGLARLLRNPPSYRERLAGIDVSNEGARIAFTLNGLRAAADDVSTVEVFRSGHIEFRFSKLDYITDAARGRPKRLFGWAIAEAIRNFVYFVAAVRDRSAITDPYLITASVPAARGYDLIAPGGRFGEGAVGTFDEECDLVLEPIVFAIDADLDGVVRELADRIWNAFHLAACPFFNDKGKFFIPDR